MAIIGTAGHVDHGKSTLVRALTGIDPDRLAEEKRRGLTIDLGFSHLALPSGLVAGVVDVPGHARFLHNMLAGVHGMDAVVLVVAADEGVRLQTREHLDIVGLLGVTRLVVALTKVDLVDAGMLALVTSEVREELRRRGTEAAVVPVSVPAGLGLEELTAELARLLASVERVDGGRPRLPVDRAFTITGFGTVVTGSLVDGALRVGQELELVPAGPGRAARARVRGLQQHGEQVDRVAPGSRVAVNLSGIDRPDIRRGQVLAPPGTLRAGARLDVRLRVLASASRGVAHGDRVAVHVGTDEVAGRVVVLEGDSIDAGAEGFVQLRLGRGVAARDGDLLVLRRPSPAETVAGGSIVDAHPAAHRRGAAAAGLVRERSGGEGRVGDELRRAARGTDAETLATRLAMTRQDVEAHLERLVGAGRAIRAGGLVFDEQPWARLEGIVHQALRAFHADNPLRAGMPREPLRAALGLQGRALGEALDAMIGRGAIEASGSEMVRVPGHQPSLTAAQRRLIDAALAELAREPLSPPGLTQLREIGLSDALSLYLEEQELAVRVGPETLMLPDALRTAESRLRGYLAEHETMTVAAARDALGSSRRTVVPLLEYFDAARVTRRERG